MVDRCKVDLLVKILEALIKTSETVPSAQESKQACPVRTSLRVGGSRCNLPGLSVIVPIVLDDAGVVKML